MRAARRGRTRPPPHPLGNFSINHLSTVSVSADHVDVRYVLDQAEIPTVQERSLGPAERARQEARRGRRGGWCCSSTAAASRSSRPGRPQLSFPDGAGGLKTTRVELPLRAVVDHPHRVELHDGTFPGRIGWKAVVSAPGKGTAVRSDAPTGDPTGGLRRYPQDLLSSPLDRRDANFSVAPGDGTLVAPKGEHGGTAETRAASDGFAGLFADAASGQGVLLLLLLAAFGWGALHALSPGHGKAMVAAYLVGTRGSARHAVALGATVTVTHTIGVFALGVVTLALSQYVLPEDLYPWLTLVSGLLVVVVGAGVLRSRVLKARHDHAHAHHHEHARPRPRPSPRPRPELEGAARHGGGRRPDPLPVRPRRTAGRDLAARSGPRTAADHGLQPRPRRDPHGTRPGRRLRPQVDPAAPRGGPACGRSARRRRRC